LKVASVVGARPNFVKLSALTPYLSSYEHIVIHTGQHYDYELSRIFFEQLELPEPNYYLGVGSGTHGYQVGEIIKRLEKVLLPEKPDIVIVYGDTNSTLAGALAAVKVGLQVAHVEAGLRSYDMKMAEEINRRVTDHISTFLFAPTKTAVKNLKRENVMGKVFSTGDVHVDVLNKLLPLAENSRILKNLGLEPRKYIVATVHRAENTDHLERLTSIVEILLQASKITHVVLPLHPRTREALHKFNLYSKLERGNIRILKPLGYLDFIKLLKYSIVAITDSGGVQREAFLLKIPCLVLRDRTEWVELVESGWVKLVDVDSIQAMKELEKLTMKTPKNAPPILGRGDAGESIVRILREHLEDRV